MPQHPKICSAGLSGANPAPRGVHRSPERGFHPGGQPGGLVAKVGTLLSMRLGVLCCHADWKHVTPIRKEAFQRLSAVGNLPRHCQSVIGLYGRSSPSRPHASLWRTSWRGGREARGQGTETVPPITLALAAERRVSSIEGCALRRRRDALTSGAWLGWWFTSSWEELPSLTVIRASVRPCALRRDK